MRLVTTPILILSEFPDKHSSKFKAKEKGGLGVCSPSLLNKALLCKWCCRYSSEGETLWKVIKRKYGEEEKGWQSCEVRLSWGRFMESYKEWDFQGCGLARIDYFCIFPLGT
ncbi:hypothetical protein CK203_025328 [Vitis vinifera]|uniref:Uncharacterized protein n=1 Tax=Vitis vinifera TaxID=29760 RepID=A0A438IZJ6_VITVI|nr:hypothetical protein CK203_025328 [Vitis vinifera]